MGLPPTQRTGDPLRVPAWRRPRQARPRALGAVFSRENAIRYAGHRIRPGPIAHGVENFGAGWYASLGAGWRMIEHACPEADSGRQAQLGVALN